MNPSSPSDSAHAQRELPAVTAEGEALVSAPARLRYVDQAAPAPGEGVQLAPGIAWLRIPLPIDLDHINVWLLEAENGCIVVDTGMAAVVAKEAWARIEREVLGSRKLRAVFVTHVHPDHIGLAAWLQERHGVPVLMSSRTQALARMLIGGEGSVLPEDAAAFMRSHGLSDREQIAPMLKPERFASITSGVPRIERCVEDGEHLLWAVTAWKALRTDGHAEGHLCLWSESDRVLISGDQVLPTISSNISFSFRHGDPDPLGSYLASLERLRGLPEDTLVLPSHGLPFRGLRHRIDDLLAHHREQLAKIEDLCREPRLLAELLPFLFRRELKGIHFFLALGEALSHLEYLARAGRLERVRADGVVRYAS